VFLPHKHKARQYIGVANCRSKSKIVKVKEKAYSAGGDCHAAAFLTNTGSSSAARLQGGNEWSAITVLMALISYHILDFVLCFFFRCGS